MTLTDLRYIVSLAREKHFGHAARQCNVTQPTLSVSIKKLEHSLGVILFERSKHEIKLTSVGMRIVEQAEKTLCEAGQIREIAQSERDPLVGPLRVGVIYTVAPYLLPSLILLLKDRAAQMPLIIEEGYTEYLMQKVRESLLDVLIVAMPIHAPPMVVQPIYEEELVMLLPRGHDLEKRADIGVDDLAQTSLLMLGHRNCFRDQVLDLCQRATNGGPHVITGGSLQTIRHMVASGLAPSVMPASTVQDIGAEDRLLCVRHFCKPTPKRRIGLVWRSSFPRHQAIDILRHAVIDCKLAGTHPIPRPGECKPAPL